MNTAMEELSELKQEQIQDLLNKLKAITEPEEIPFKIDFNAGAQIKEMRHQLRISQAELAELLQLSRARISTLEKQSNMSIRNFIEVAHKMGFTVSITKKSPVT